MATDSIINDEVLQLQHELEHHLGNLHSPEYPWEIRFSPITGGRGIFAKRNIAMHEIIFRDRSLILGPRFYRDNVLCVVCYKIIEHLERDLCRNGCSLPICCDACQNAESHRSECEIIRNWKPKNPNKLSTSILHALSSFRGLLLNERQKNLLRLLQANALTNQEEEVDTAINDFSEFSEDTDLKNFLYFITGILNTNAFETVFIRDVFNPPSLRGLFPLAGVLNHKCVPTARYSFDSEHTITFRAIREIKKDEEIYTSYSRTLIASPLRRLLMKKTKDFYCYCDRCADATELGTYLAAINCVRELCSGVTLPADPLNIMSHWICNECGKTYPSKKMFTLQNMISVFISSKMHREHFREIMRFLKTVLPSNLPPTNQLVIELKLFLISIIKYDENNNSEYTLDDFLDKEKFCLDVLSVFRKLGMTESVKSGKLYFELYETRNAIMHLKKDENRDHIALEKMQSENEKLLQHSWTILHDNITAPTKLREMIAAKKMSH